MKVFHKDADYAVRTLIYLAVQDRSQYISAGLLSEELALPRNFLRRICSELIRAGILQSREGAKGGVRLGKEPSEITVLQIIEIFHGSPELSDCTFRKALCPNRKTCPLRRRILGIEQIVSREFEAITIESLVDDVLHPLTPTIERNQK